MWPVHRRRNPLLALLLAGLLLLGGCQPPVANAAEDDHSTKVSNVAANDRATSVAGEGNGLMGFRVAIDPGHGGIDHGAVGVNGTTEDAINLQIATQLAKQFTLAGADVLMTRESSDVDYTGTANTKKRRDMQNRARLITAQDSQVVISIHLNSYPDRRYRGAQTFYQKGSDEGKKLADAVQQALIDGLEGNNKRGSKAGDYFILKVTEKPSILVEAGFLTNAEDEKLLVQADYQTKIAACIFHGVCDYLGVQ